MKVSFERAAFDDFNEWASSNKKVHAKIIALIKDLDVLTACFVA